MQCGDEHFIRKVLVIYMIVIIDRDKERQCIENNYNVYKLKRHLYSLNCTSGPFHAKTSISDKK